MQGRMLLLAGVLSFGLLNSMALRATPPAEPKRSDPTAAEPALDRPLDITAAKFESPAIRTRLAKFESAAVEVAPQDWEYVPWRWRGATGNRPERLFNAATTWSSRARDQIPWGSIALVTTPRDMKPGTPKVFHDVSLFVISRTGGDRWSHHMRYIENWADDKRVQEHFQVTLYPGPEPPVDPRQIVALPLRSAGVRKRVGSVEYDVGVSLNDQNNEIGIARRYLASPQSLREAALADCEAMEKLAAKKIRAGEGISQVVDLSIRVPVKQTRSIPDFPRDEPAKFHPPLPAKYALTDAEREEVIEQLRADLAARRALVEEHAAELHAAIERAFPLGRVLSELDGGNLDGDKQP
jgi:hypothetical protein